ncbi:MAG: SprB repeat-containing protein, partial [Actinobacteria bacterium]|nr:SprB repeat-containing protein [Actinomycetota bacterium]
MEVLEQPELSLECEGTDGLCGDDASASVTPIGGTAPFTYLWSNGATTASISGIPGGTYSVIVTDANQCNATCEVTVESQPALVIDCSAEEGICGDDGSASASIISGTQPYTYLWSNGETTADISGLAAGIYSVTVTDANGCEATCEVDVAVQPALTAECEGTDGLCGDDASASVTPIGGTAPYTYLWSNGATTASISNIAEGSYSVTVTDANGCTAVCTTSVVTSVEPLVDIFCENDLQPIINNGGSQTVENTDNCQGPYAFWTNNLVNGYTSQKHWTVTDGSFTEGPAGTAQLTATYTNRDDNSLIFEASIAFSGRTFTAPPDSPKLDGVCGGQTFDSSDWYYYTSTEGILVGQGALAGAVVEISRFDESFQIGTGANLNNDSEYG